MNLTTSWNLGHCRLCIVTVSVSALPLPLGGSWIVTVTAGHWSVTWTEQSFKFQWANQQTEWTANSELSLHCCLTKFSVREEAQKLRKYPMLPWYSLLFRTAHSWYLQSIPQAVLNAMCTSAGLRNHLGLSIYRLTWVVQKNLPPCTQERSGDWQQTRGTLIACLSLRPLWHEMRVCRKASLQLRGTKCLEQVSSLMKHFMCGKLKRSHTRDLYVVVEQG